ncbi:hypothetical protein BGZ61DRAFT_452026 [Ilyonectria robusta]|uniref:uncharacterized protein n=1 Tax=Ilyonectria robusta TaxID=1079257 RepID=UPI001E8EC1C7|nr:uncharacterized protein BGZ61DRAFT_452026 [Ilyonectria robusta]KAH8694518.1 hypothetical protein BGZ61DRAFT_452026 [Ilyonectria robusta]
MPVNADLMPYATTWHSVFLPQVKTFPGGPRRTTRTAKCPPPREQLRNNNTMPISQLNSCLATPHARPAVALPRSKLSLHGASSLGEAFSSPSSSWAGSPTASRILILILARHARSMERPMERITAWFGPCEWSSVGAGLSASGGPPGEGLWEPVL